MLFDDRLDGIDDAGSRAALVESRSPRPVSVGRRRKMAGLPVHIGQKYLNV
jgi:hypothetical protein